MRLSGQTHRVFFQSYLGGWGTSKCMKKKSWDFFLQKRTQKEVGNEWLMIIKRGGLKKYEDPFAKKVALNAYFQN